MKCSYTVFCVYLKNCKFSSAVLELDTYQENITYAVLENFPQFWKKILK